MSESIAKRDGYPHAKDPAHKDCYEMLLLLQQRLTEKNGRIWDALQVLDKSPIGSELSIAGATIRTAVRILNGEEA